MCLSSSDRFVLLLAVTSDHRSQHMCFDCLLLCTGGGSACCLPVQGDVVGHSALLYLELASSDLSPFHTHYYMADSVLDLVAAAWLRFAGFAILLTCTRRGSDAATVPCLSQSLRAGWL